jgi:hypothetical protein
MFMARSVTMDLVLFLIRLVVGGLLASHGFQKLFGWLGGFGFAGTGAYLESHGFRHGRAFAALVVAVVSAGVVLASRGRPMPAAGSADGAMGSRGERLSRQCEAIGEAIGARSEHSTSRWACLLPLPGGLWAHAGARNGRDAIVD